MKKMIALILMFASPALANGGYAKEAFAVDTGPIDNPYDKVIRDLHNNKVGKAPQQCARGKKCKGPKPKYVKKDKKLLAKNKKHHRKSDYSKGGK